MLHRVVRIVSLTLHGWTRCTQSCNTKFCSLHAVVLCTHQVCGDESAQRCTTNFPSNLCSRHASHINIAIYSFFKIYQTALEFAQFNGCFHIEWLVFQNDFCLFLPFSFKGKKHRKIPKMSNFIGLKRNGFIHFESVHTEKYAFLEVLRKYAHIFWNA